MLCRTVLAVSAMLLLATPLRAKDCPVQEFGLEARENAIRKASTCRQALEIMDACAYGAGGDTGLSVAVRERCEPEFLPKLGKAQKRAYDRELKRCDRKYARESGTMYRSFTAFCQAQSAVAHAGRFGATAKAK
jgi:phage protein U